MRQSAPHRMRNSAPLATLPATSRSVPLADTISEMPVDMDARSPERTYQFRTVFLSPRNPVSLFLNRTVPLSLYRLLPR